MKKNYGLTNTEMQIMELLWQAEKPLAFREIMDVARNEWKKTWKVQTLNTYLINLQKVGLIGTNRTVTQYNAYYALCTKDEHIHKWTRKMIQECYDNSISKFFVAFTGGKRLSKEEAEEIRKMINIILRIK